MRIFRIVVVIAGLMDPSRAFAPRPTHTVVSSFRSKPGQKLLMTGSTSNNEDDADVATADVTASNAPSKFVNDGPLAWMSTYLDLFGVKEGKSVYLGPFPTEVVDSKRLADSEASARRQQAAQELININDDERQRRDEAGTVMGALSAIYVVWATLIGDDGGLSGHFLRLLSAFPIFLAVGYKLSAKTGL